MESGEKDSEKWKKLTHTPQGSDIQIIQGTRDVKSLCHVPPRGHTGNNVQVGSARQGDTNKNASPKISQQTVAL